MRQLAHSIRRVFIGVFSVPVKLYQWVISPILPNACRYDPTCSQYMLEALKVHGPIKGLWLGTKRISRCHPWGGFGYDPVPEKKHSCRHSKK
jgi:putative membrane protein insertion efficiency factor